MNALNSTGLIWVDYCIIGLVGLSALIGLSRGLIREVFSLGLWVAAGWLALHYNHAFAVHLQHAIPVESARFAVAFVLLFIGALIAGGMVVFVLGKLIASTGLDGADRLAGLLFGVARGALIVMVFVLLAGVTPLPEQTWWKQSQLIPPFQSLAVWLRSQIPAGLAAQVKFPEAILRR